MSRIEVRKVPEKDDRSLPIFAEFDRLTDEIRMQAYQLFRHRGAREGHALDDWLAAEREVCWPAAELAETGDAFTLKVALAGFEPQRHVGLEPLLAIRTSAIETLRITGFAAEGDFALGFFAKITLFGG